MLQHPDVYSKEYWAFIAKIERDFNIDPTDPMYEDKLDEAFNAISDDIHIDFTCGRPLS